MVSKSTLAILLALLVIFNGQSAAQWEDALNSLLGEVASCQSPIDPQGPCSFITSRAIKAVYGINDFDSADNGHMSVFDIDEHVMGSSNWTHIGRADAQDALTKAQELANSGKAVLAILTEKPAGHIVIILPGELTPSGKWGLQVPNSASFFLHVPRLSYAGKSLSYAYKEPQKVELYSKN